MHRIFAILFHSIEEVREHCYNYCQSIVCVLNMHVTDMTGFQTGITSMLIYRPINNRFRWISCCSLITSTWTITRAISLFTVLKSNICWFRIKQNQMSLQQRQMGIVIIDHLNDLNSIMGQMLLDYLLLSVHLICVTYRYPTVLMLKLLHRRFCIFGIHTHKNEQKKNKTKHKFMNRK